MHISSDFETMYNNIVQRSYQYFTINHIKTLVLGISGGVDSALVAALMKEIKIPLIGVCIPMDGNTTAEINRARAVTKAFCDAESETILAAAQIEGMNDCANILIKLLVGDDCSGETKSAKEVMNIRKGNIKARLRMIQLFDIARKRNGLVLSTDNLTEYYLGFWTLHGDVGNFAPIQNMWKTEVYGLTEYLAKKYEDEDGSKYNALMDCVKALPTDGLGISNSDFDQIIPGQDESRTSKDRYNEIDKLLIDFLYISCPKTFDQLIDLTEHPVIKRFLATRFKRKDPVSIARQDLEHIFPLSITQFTIPR